MENSQLVAIVSRLSAMIKSADEEVVSRRFEKNGEERGIMTYDPKSGMFELEELSSKQKFQFDNIDLAAIEIYDLLDD